MRSSLAGQSPRASPFQLEVAAVLRQKARRSLDSEPGGAPGKPENCFDDRIRQTALVGHVAESSAGAVHPANNGNDREEATLHSYAATLLPSELPSTPTTPDCSAKKPSVQGKAAVGKEPGWALHRSDFVHQFAGEKDDLILMRRDRLVAALTDVVISRQP